MTTDNPGPIDTDWSALILNETDPAKVWLGIFSHLRNLALGSPRGNMLDRATIVADRLLAESAWNLWEEFPSYAPSVIQELQHFWMKTSVTGTAVLILDALSLRELPLIVNAAQQREIAPTRVEVLGSEVPSQTDSFARALGLTSRSKLFNNQAPSTFIFSGPDVFAHVLDSPFPDCVG